MSFDRCSCLQQLGWRQGPKFSLEMGPQVKSSFFISQQNIVSVPASMKQSWSVFTGDCRVDRSLGVIRLRLINHPPAWLWASRGELLKCLSHAIQDLGSLWKYTVQRLSEFGTLILGTVSLLASLLSNRCLADGHCLTHWSLSSAYTMIHIVFISCSIV